MPGKKTIILRELPSYGDMLICGVSTQLHHYVKDFDEIIYMIFYEYDFTMKEIGDFLGGHYSNVSRAVKRHESTKKNGNQKDKNIALQDQTT